MEIENKINQYSDMVYRIAYSMTKRKCDAEDIYQNVFMKFFKSLESFADSEYEKRWLIRVTVNECNMLFRRSFFKKEVELDENICVPCNDEYDTSVYSYVKQFPSKYRIVIYLHYYEGYKVEEISLILKCSVGTVKSQLSRARNMLKDIMKEDFDEK